MEQLMKFKREEIIKSWFTLTKSMLEQDVLTLEKDEKAITADDVVLIRFGDHIIMKV